jgi:hypothetical protein
MIFNNREIAIGTWIIFIVFIGVLTKPVRDFIKNIFPIIFCRKFVVFYCVFISFFVVTIYFLSRIGFWEFDLLKDTILWVLFVELPLFVKAIEKAKDAHFFVKLMKENIALIVIIGFVLNFWAFGLLIEFILVPCIVFIAVLYAIASLDEKHLKVRNFFNCIFLILGVAISIFTIINIIQTPEQFFSITTLKELLLPILLLVLNLPVVYGLALHNTYEQLFIRLKGNTKEKAKMKRRLIFFAGVNLEKVTSVRENIAQTLIISLSERDLNENLKRLEKRRSLQIGENYMKRSNLYITSCIIGLVMSVIGLILSNNQVSIRDIIARNYYLDINRLKEIITYICSVGFVFCICLLVISIGFKRKKNEDISQIKKFAFYELLGLIKRQYSMLKEFPPMDKPYELFSLYVTTAYEIKNECDKALNLYDNLLRRWEKEVIQQLDTASTALVYDIGLKEADIKQYDIESFSRYYIEMSESAPQNEKINVYISTIKSDVEKYTEHIKLCHEEFKDYL